MNTSLFGNILIFKFIWFMFCLLLFDGFLGSLYTALPMRNCVSILFLLILGVSSSAQAGVKEDFLRLQGLLDSFVRTASLGAPYGPCFSKNQSFQPSFEYACKVLNPAWNRFYIYEGSNGKIPNFDFLARVGSANFCFDRKLKAEREELRKAFALAESQRKGKLFAEGRQDLLVAEEKASLAKSNRDELESKALSSEARRVGDYFRIEVCKLTDQVMDSVLRNGDAIAWTQYLKAFNLNSLECHSTRSSESGNYKYSGHLPGGFVLDESLFSVFGFERPSLSAETWDLLQKIDRLEMEASHRSHQYYGRIDRSYNSSSRSAELDLFMPSPVFDLDQIYLDKLSSLDQFIAKVLEFRQSRNRIVSTFAEVRAMIVERLKKAQKGQDQAGLERLVNMIERVKTVRMNFEVASKSCFDRIAHYSPEIHSINICPQVFDIPKMALAQLIAHEVSHSIDPCQVSFDLKKLSEKYFVDLIQKEDSALPRPILFQEGIRLSDNPFAKTLSCLASNESIQAHLHDSTTFERKLKKGLEESRLDLARRVSPENSLHEEIRALEGALADVPGFMRKHGACLEFPPRGSSQLGEVFADWMAAEVVGDLVAREGKEELRGTLAFEGASLFVSLGSKNGVEAAFFDIDRELVALGCEVPSSDKTSLFESSAPTKVVHESMEPDPGVSHPEDSKRIEKSSDSRKESSPAVDPDFVPAHPVSSRRIERIYLAHPVIKKALGIGPDLGAKYCE